MGRLTRARGMRGGSVKSTWSEIQQLRTRVRDLESMRERLSRLYFSQVETGKARMEKLHRILEVVTRLNSSLDLDTLLGQIVGAVQKSLGFRIVLLRILDPETGMLRARAFAGLSPEAISQLEQRDIPEPEFRAWLMDEFRVSRSFFISHKHTFSRELPDGVVHDLGRREDFEWHEEDVPLEPLYTRTGELMAYLSVDDPVDRLVPSRETIEMLEIFGNHVVVALENARLMQSLASHSRELEAANRRMDEVNRLKSSFLSAVSHELRTPLTSIRAYLDSLREDLDKPGLEAPLRFVHILEDESKRLSDLIDSVLSFSHLERGSNPMQFKTLDARDTVLSAAEALAPMAEAKKVSLQTELSSADIWIEADLELLKQLVLHLGGNAIKFTAPGGSVRIAAEPGDEDGLVLSVSDTGIGIPEDQLERIFERFYQVDQSLVRRFGGTGLGLALCKSIVEIHGGTIEVRSSVGDGSTFLVRLPRQAPERKAAWSQGIADVALDADEALRLTLATAARVAGAERAVVFTAGADGTLDLRATFGLPERDARAMRVPSDRGIAGWILTHDETVVSADPAADRRFAGESFPLLGAGPIAGLPVKHEGRVRGAILLALPAVPDDGAVEQLEAVAAAVAGVLANADGALESRARLSSAADALRSEVTRLSVGRVASSDRLRLARSLAGQLGLDAVEAGWIAWASAADASDAVLVETRPADGKGGDRPEPVRRLLAQRHERVDGTGTPQGLVGDEIALGARILAVVAAWDAATMEGTGEAQTQCAAIEELRKRAGREFDPMVVEALVQLGVEEGWLDRGWALGSSDAAQAA
jgi:signal transduction histidine kinase